jgi:hypothetical protein
MIRDVQKLYRKMNLFHKPEIPSAVHESDTGILRIMLTALCSW